MDEARGHARWVRVSHWIVTASLLRPGLHRRPHPHGPPAALLGRGRATTSRRRSSSCRSAGTTSMAAGTRRTPFFAGRRRAGQRQPDLRHLQPERLGTQPALPRRVVPRRARRRSICCRRAVRRALPLARLARARASSRRVSSGATSSITCGCGFRRRRRAALRRAAEDAPTRSVIFVAAPLMVLTGLAMSPAVDGGVSVPAAPVRRLPVRPHDPFLRLRRARAVRARARRDGGRVRLPTADAGDDRGRVT